MKNQLSKGSAPVILFLFVMAFIVNSCKKDVAVSQTTPLSQKQQIDVVNEAKTWFQRNEAINKPSVAINDAGSTRKWYDGLNPAWDTTLVYEKNKGTVIEMPLLNSAVAFLVNTTDGTKANLQTNYTKTSYLIQKDSVGVFKGWFMVLIADTTYINGDFSKLDKNTYQQRDPAYSGRLMYFDINGKFAGGWRYQNGAITQTLTLTNAAASGGGPQINSEKPKGTNSVCVTSGVTTVTWACVGAGSVGPPKWNASVRTNDEGVCIPYFTTKDVTECIGGGSGGGGGNNPPPGGNGNTSFPSPIDQGCKSLAPASVDGKKVNLQPPVPTTPDDPCLVKPPVPEPVVPKQDIIDSLKSYPCAQNLVRSIPNMKDSISALINKTFGNNNGSLNIIFRASTDFTDSNEDGYADDALSKLSVSTNSSTGTVLAVNGNLVITLNGDVLATATQDYILVTLYHEALHGYLDIMRAKLTPTQFNQQFPGVTTITTTNANGSKTIKNVVNDHSVMANTFLSGLTNLLKTFHPNLPSNVATALAEGGIIDDPSILPANFAERNSSSSSKGIKCN